MREAQTEVLVVGAGPVGLWSALLLAEAGVQVTIIDREQRTTARSYACALHSHTLSLLQEVGLGQALLERGRRVQRVGFYDGQTQRAELDLAKLGGDFPYLLILPQSELEGVLEARLRQAGVTVQWNYRFQDFTEESEMIEATIEELGGTGTGYIVPHWETLVRDRAPLRAQFVIGADGQNSTVRQRAHIESERLSEVTSFAAYEFEPDQPPGDELRVALEGTTNVLWPLAGNRCRWTFQMLHAELQSAFPEKERRSARLAQPTVDERIRQYVEKVAQKRAPWFNAGVKEITWCTEVSFEQRVVKQFGRSRCWLCGDAAHQTGPAGVQSMNAGLHEARKLTRMLRRILSQEAGMDSLRRSDQPELDQWRRLIGLAGGLQGRNNTDKWVLAHAARILPCLPATGPDLIRLADQLGLDWV
jgi:2-polyprenyl-6-methoxyphenol hydroxylase-like FAD-dependent oxidoreductase